MHKGTPDIKVGTVFTPVYKTVCGYTAEWLKCISYTYTSYAGLALNGCIATNAHVTYMLSTYRFLLGVINHMQLHNTWLSVVLYSVRHQLWEHMTFDWGVNVIWLSGRMTKAAGGVLKTTFGLSNKSQHPLWNTLLRCCPLLPSLQYGNRDVFDCLLNTSTFKKLQDFCSMNTTWKCIKTTRVGVHNARQRKKKGI